MDLKELKKADAKMASFFKLQNIFQKNGSFPVSASVWAF